MKKIVFLSITAVSVSIPDGAHAEAFARIIPSGLGGTLLITDSAANLKKVYDVIQEEDVKPSAELKTAWDDAEARRKATKPE